MSYEKYTWQTGEIITAEKLNHIENATGVIVFDLRSLDTEDSDAVNAFFSNILSRYNSGGALYTSSGCIPDIFEEDGYTTIEWYDPFEVEATEYQVTFSRTKIDAISQDGINWTFITNLESYPMAKISAAPPQ